MPRVLAFPISFPPSHVKNRENFAILHKSSVHRDTTHKTGTNPGKPGRMVTLAYTSIHDRLVKACPLVDQTSLKFVDVSNSGSVNFLLLYTPDARFRSGEFGGHSVGGMKYGT